MNTKYCYTCKQTKSLDMFYKDIANTTGYMPRCMPCHRVYAKKHANTPNGKKVNILKQERMRKKYPEKFTAREKLRYAVISKKIIKPVNCDKCGLGGKIEGHHEDYSKPLDVMWLCHLCHKVLHGRIIDLTLLERDK